MPRLGRLSLVVRGVALAIFAVVLLAPVPYQHRTSVSIGFTMERDVVTRSHDTLTLVGMLRDRSERQERLTLVWLATALGLVAWAELERRGRLTRSVVTEAARGIVLVFATGCFFLRKVEILRFGSLRPAVGVVLVDAAALAFCLATLVGWLVIRRDASRAASSSPTGEA